VNEALWTEKYRPRSVSDCILPERLKKTFQAYVDNKKIPNLLFTGSHPGVGKTTVARAMCEEIGLNYLFLYSSDERGIDTMRHKVSQYASSISFTKYKKVVILDEADGITHDAQQALRGVIERFQNNCTFILTCNFKDRLIEPIHSRCVVEDFTLRREERSKIAGLFLKRLKKILEHESVPYDEAALVEIIKKFFPDFRRTIGELQRFAVSGRIDAGVVAQIAGLRNLGELTKTLKEKDFNEMRKWVATNSDFDKYQIWRKLYTALGEHMKPETIPIFIMALNQHDYQSAFVADQELNLVACLTTVMADCEFK